MLHKVYLTEQWYPAVNSDDAEVYELLLTEFMPAIDSTLNDDALQEPPNAR